MFGQSLFKKNKTLAVKTVRNEIEFEEALLDKFAQEREEDFEERKLEVPLSNKILLALSICFLLGEIVFLAKSWEFQVFSGSHFAALAHQNTIRQIPLLSERGVIYDQGFKQLAFNKPSFDLVCDQRDVPAAREEKKQIIERIAVILGKSFDELKELFEETKNLEVLVQENLSHEQLVLFQTKIQDLKGCEARKSAKREYMEGESFAHVIGYTAKISPEELEKQKNYFVIEQLGKMGVEKSYEHVLRGQPGAIVLRKDARGKTIQDQGVIPPSPGKNVVLWLDSEFQKKILGAFQKAFENTGATKGTTVALDPSTGGVLALVSLPSFDNNMFTQGISQEKWQALLQNPADPLFNRATGGIGYPTGSVIKPLVGLAALQERIIAEHTKIFSPLELCVWNKYLERDECFRDWTFHGESDIKRAIAESVNTFFYIVGGGYETLKGLGPEKIKEYIALFGWGERTGIDLPGEGKGILPPVDRNWRLGDTYHLSIGQGPFAITPLQVAAAFSAIANRGKLLRPQMVKSVVDSEKRVVHEFEPKVIRENFVDSRNIEIIRKGMRQTVTAGSATRWLDALAVPAAAKTGTAQTGKKDRDGKDYLYAWTVAFAPYENPEIVLVVLIEDVKEGQVSTLPLVKEVLEWYFTR